MSPTMNRREFGQAMGGLVIAFSMAPSLSEGAENPTRLPGTLDANKRLDSWLRIDPRGTVSVFTGRVELGQGNVTALGQIVAEELDIAFIRVEMIAVDTKSSPNEGVTAGSNSIEAGGAAVRSPPPQARGDLLWAPGPKTGGTPPKLLVRHRALPRPGTTAKTRHWGISQDA